MPDAMSPKSRPRIETIGLDVYLFFTLDAPLLLAEDPREAAIPEHPERSWPVERPKRVDRPRRLFGGPGSGIP